MLSSVTHPLPPSLPHTQARQTFSRLSHIPSSACDRGPVGSDVSNNGEVYGRRRSAINGIGRIALAIS